MLFVTEVIFCYTICKKNLCELCGPYEHSSSGDSLKLPCNFYAPYLC